MDWTSFNVKDAHLFIRAPAASYATTAADAVRTASEALCLVRQGWAASYGRPLDNIVQRVSYGIEQCAAISHGASTAGYSINAS